MASFDMASKSFNFTVLDQYGDSDRASTSCSNASNGPSHHGDAALTEISGNRNNGISSSPDGLAARLEELHIRTPAKVGLDTTEDLLEWTPVNRSRGLKSRPQLAASTFDKVLETVKAAMPAVASAPSTHDVGKENPLSKQREELYQPDFMQLAKHKAGKFEWVVSLPAQDKDISTEEATTRPRSSTQGSSASNKSAKKVRFGCTMVRADGHSELVRRHRSNSGNTFTLIATPIDSDDKASTEHIESIGGNFVKMAKPEIAKADEVKSLHGIMEEAKSLNNSMMTNGKDDIGSHHAQSLDGAVDYASQAVSNASTAGSTPRDLKDFADFPISSPSAAATKDKKESNVVDETLCFPPEPSYTKQAKAFDESLCFPPEPSSITMSSEENIDVTLSMQPSPASSFVASPSSRIEDSIEALDQFEEQFEAISAATQLDHVMSPQRVSRPMPSLIVADKTPARRALPATTKAATTTTQSPSYVNKTTTTTKRLSISKPSSLQPPKPLARTVKPPTVPTFELPGDAVARQLKARREARLSISSATAPSQMPRRMSVSPTKTSAVGKPPTRPNFELPGEAISRRKREEREAKLKAEQEEERKRREFKARPIRTSISHGNTSYRETAASRARASSIMKTATEKVTPPSNTRRSMASTFNGRPSISRPALNLGSAPSSASKASTVRGSRRPNNLSNETANKDKIKSPGNYPSSTEPTKRRGSRISVIDRFRDMNPTYPASNSANLHDLILAINPSPEEIEENRREAEEVARKRAEEWPQNYAEGIARAEELDSGRKVHQEIFTSGSDDLYETIMNINPTATEMEENRREAEELAERRREEWPQTYAKGLAHAKKTDRLWKEHQEKKRSGLVTEGCGSHADDGW